MITTVSLLYDLDRKLNKIATSKHQSIELENKVIALNEAQIQLVKQKIDQNNIYGLGFDSFKKRYDDLQMLVVQEEKSSPAKDTNSKLFKYLIPTEGLKQEYMFFVDLYCLADKGKCKQRQLFMLKSRIKHADITDVLLNTNTCPSFEYQEVPVTTSSNQIEIYGATDFTITEAYVSYVRYPKVIDAEGYVHFDETDSVNQDCELPLYLKDELVDLAVQELAMDTENQSAVQYSQMRIQNNE